MITLTTSSETGSTCRPATSNPACRTTTALTPALQLVTTEVPPGP